MITSIEALETSVSKLEPEFAETLKQELHIKEMADLSVSQDLAAVDMASEIKEETPVATSSADVPPDLGERYQILKHLGSGGMGSVWKVYDKILEETFAIKVLHQNLASSAESLKRIKQEARLAKDLTHANIAAVFDATEDAKGRPCIIMRYAEGETLQCLLLREGRLHPSRAEHIFNQLIDAINHSHMNGVIHRDIKPSNIIISLTESGVEMVSLVDFGIAKSVYEEVSKTQALTKSGDVLGSPRYMSPEQFLGQEIGSASDLYSIGCVYYEMLTGHPPFTEENPVKLILQHLNETPDFSCLPSDKAYEISLLLHKDPKQRKHVSNSLRRVAWIPDGISIDQIEQFKRNFCIAVVVVLIPQLVIWRSILFAPEAALQLLWLSSLVLLSINLLVKGFNALAKNEVQKQLIELVNISTGFIIVVSLLFLFFNPMQSLQALFYAPVQALFAALAIFALTLMDSSRARLNKLFTHPALKLMAILSPPLITFLMLASYSELAIFYPRFVFGQKESKQEYLKECLKLPHTVEADKTRLGILGMYDQGSYSLPLFRDVCLQIINNQTEASNWLKLTAYRHLASTYSGKTAASQTKWRETTKNALALLKQTIDASRDWKPDFMHKALQDRFRDSLLSIADDCIAHGDLELATDALCLKSESRVVESLADMRRSTELWEKISDKRSTLSD